MKNAINILIIDDSMMDRLVVKTQFMYTCDKVNIQEAGDGEEALGFLENCQYDFPDLILVDINMPVLNGFEFLQKYEEVFWKQHPPTLLYIITSSSAEEDIEKSKGFASLRDFLTKPLKSEKAKSLCKTILHLKHIKHGTSPS